MNFCIGSYGHQAARGEDLFFAIKHRGHMMGCGHIQDRRIVQILGKHNSVLPEDLRSEIFNRLVSENIIGTDRSGWGL